jgi:hypothetical protein
VNRITKDRIPRNVAKSWSSWKTSSFSRRTQLNVVGWLVAELFRSNVVFVKARLRTEIILVQLRQPRAIREKLVTTYFSICPLARERLYAPDEAGASLESLRQWKYSTNSFELPATSSVTSAVNQLRDVHENIRTLTLV